MSGLPPDPSTSPSFTPPTAPGVPGTPAQEPQRTDPGLSSPQAYGPPANPPQAYGPPANPPQGYAPPSYSPYPPAMSPYPPARAVPETDGVSIVALVTGCVGIGPVALALGIIGLHRTGSHRKRGRGLAVAGTVLGAVMTLAAAGLLVSFFTAGLLGPSATFDASYAPDDPDYAYLWDRCDDGDMEACDVLYDFSDIDSQEEQFGFTCGNRLADGPGDYCSSLSEDEVDSLTEKRDAGAPAEEPTPSERSDV